MKEDNIKPFPQCRTSEGVLRQAIESYPDGVLILGYDEKGNIDARSTSNLTGKDILWLVESFTLKLLKGDYSE